MSKPEITIVTDPLPWGRELLNESARRALRSLRDVVRPSLNPLIHHLYRGHFAVTRSLIEGLQDIDVRFNYNPYRPLDLADNVIVLSGVRTLRQMICFKRNGLIRKIFAGPNIVTFSSDYGSILASDDIDAVITPSSWVTDLYIEDNPSLKGRIFSWPAGVDINYWQPDVARERDHILIFDKRSEGIDPNRVKPYTDFLCARGWQVDLLLRSDTQFYEQWQYRDLLQRCCLMLGFTVGSESQGIAWSEAWATDVPTLILRKSSNILQGRRYTCSTAPYLNSQNGIFFEDFGDFVNQFNYWQANRDKFSPRSWVLENMSDEVCASVLYKLINDYQIS